MRSEQGVCLGQGRALDKGGVYMLMHIYIHTNIYDTKITKLISLGMVRITLSGIGTDDGGVCRSHTQAFFKKNICQM